MHYTVSRVTKAAHFISFPSQAKIQTTFITHQQHCEMPNSFEPSAFSAGYWKLSALTSSSCVSVSASGREGQHEHKMIRVSKMTKVTVQALNNSKLVQSAFSWTTQVSRYQNSQPFLIFVRPQESPSYPMPILASRHWLACQQSVLQEWYTEDERINVDSCR